MTRISFQENNFNSTIFACALGPLPIRVVGPVEEGWVVTSEVASEEELWAALDKYSSGEVVEEEDGSVYVTFGEERHLAYSPEADSPLDMGSVPVDALLLAEEARREAYATSLAMDGNPLTMVKLKNADDRGSVAFMGAIADFLAASGGADEG